MPFAATAVNHIQIIHHGVRKKVKRKKDLCQPALNPEIPYLQK
jgi:hypothetical protein